MSNKWSDVNTVRKTFVDFFVEKCGHEHIVSSPVIPHEDPTLLFINAGMNQFKSIFVGTVDPNSAFGKLKRAANSQKCIRAGGKHNDLEDVGKDSYHHTFFEMLGNWSFGDYFKTEAIDWAWELLTKVYGLDPERIYVTYFGGDERIPTCKPDLEARDLWLRYLPADRVLPYGAKENFWEMAETGPCGPCSEIHYDKLGGRFVPELVNADDPTLVEIWNLVFMQYNREIDRSLTPLPFGSVDTGMGMERLASILIDKPSNYDISGFQHIFKGIEAAIPNLRPYSGLEGAADVEGIDMAYRVVADHIRTLSIAIADGAMPSNDGRGYVLRRVLRRAVRYGKQKLGAPTKPWFCTLVQTVVDTLGDAFPSLKEKQAHIEATIEAEERQFISTLERGLREFDRVLKDAKAAGKTTFPGGEPGAFTLFTTYGFPLDLTQLMAEEQGMQVDLAEYEAQFEEHRRKAREGGKKKTVFEFKLQQEQLHILANEYKAPRADDSHIYNWTPAVGAGKSIEAKVIAILTEKDGFQKTVASPAGEGESVAVGVVLDATNFYPEAGGQVADIGVISGTASDDDFQGQVVDVQRFGTYICHTVKVTNGTIAEGQTVTLSPDFERRALTAKNHTGTHVLNFALRKVLGNDIEQKGSLVDEQRLRFDFSYNGVPPAEQLEEVEAIVLSEIEAKRAVFAKAIALESAKQIRGLRFMAGEQYPNPVRVLSMAEDPEEMAKEGYSGLGGEGASVEFCGGTHLTNSSEIQNFVLMTEEGVAKGIRRLVGYTGPTAVAAINHGKKVAAELNEIKKLSGAELDSKISTFRGALEADSELPYLVKKALLKEVDTIKVALLEVAKQKAKALIDTAKTLGEKYAAELAASATPLVFDASAELEGDAKATDQLAKTIEAAAAGKAFVVISGLNNGPATVVVVGNAEGSVDAKVVLAKIGEALGCKGGGKPTRAVGSAKEVTSDKIAAGVAAAKAAF